MTFKKAALATAALVLSAAWTSANAYEFGSFGSAQPNGLTLGNTTAGAPPPGIYMNLQALTAQGVLIGPGGPNINGNATQAHAAGAAAAIVIAPGWQFLGATYDAVVVVPYVTGDFSSPLNVTASGRSNTLYIPVELSWTLGTSGFVVKTGFGLHAPDGQSFGPTGLGNYGPNNIFGNVVGTNGAGTLAAVGDPWWTFQPELVVSYFSNGWALTAASFLEINTQNNITHYTSGDVLHVEVSAIKSVGQWSVGPVASYMGQVTNDKASDLGYYAAIHGVVPGTFVVSTAPGGIGTTNINRYSLWSVGARLGYNFGPAALNIWALDNISQSITQGSCGATCFGAATNPHGYTVFSSLSFRLWDLGASEAPAAPIMHK